MRDISETKLQTRTTKPDSVVLGTLFQGTRGFLLIVFNVMLFIQFDRMRSIPGVDVMAVLPPSIFFLLGFMDLVMVKRVWRGDLNGWRYGITMSILILLVTPIASWFYILSPLYTTFLFAIILLFSAAEAIALSTQDARRFYGPKAIL